MLDTLRSKLYEAITTRTFDGFPPIRFPLNVARRVNMVLGSPLGPKDELAKRRAAAAKLQSLRASGVSAPQKREPAPVMVYMEKDRNTREVERVKEALQARNIAFKLLDVTGDEAALAFVMRSARCKEDELPIVFVGNHAVGGFRALVEFDVSGELVRAVFGEGARPSGPASPS